MEDLISFESKWDQLRLTNEKQHPIILGNDAIIEDRLNEKRSLVGKLSAN